ncbi:hypothetical protein M885DRAFT_417731, partial [Pelagophyceae sp. CCMP2097]
VVPGDVYVKVASTAFAVYALQMLLVPSKLVSDHFTEQSTDMVNFWIRGQSASILAALVLANNPSTPTLLAVKVMTGYSFAVGVLCPWNAKFGILTNDRGRISTKYPMHYVPEALMLGLTIAG